VGGQTDAFTARVNFSPPSALDVVPVTPAEQVGTSVLFVATVTGAHGEAETFIPVSYAVVSSGAPSSPGASDVTDTNGQVPFSYTNTVTGVDTLHVFADFDEDGSEDAGETMDIPVTWLPGPPASLDLTPAEATNTVDATHMVTAEVRDMFGNAVPGELVRFSVTGVNGVFGQPTTGSSMTNALGQASFSYVGPMPGDDTISAFADHNNDGAHDPGPGAHEPDDTATKHWTLPASTRGKARGGGDIKTIDHDNATFGLIVQMKASSPVKGNVTYQLHGRDGFKLKSLALDALVVSGDSATIFGTATIDGSDVVVFRLDLVDNGEPGRKVDTFWLRLSSAYESGEVLLKGGNVQVSN